VNNSFSTIVNQDGADENTPIWSCYQLTNTDSSTTFGFYTHCFGNAEDCDLQCGSASPDDSARPQQFGDSG